MDLYGLLEELNIALEEAAHEAVFTVEDAQKVRIDIEGVGCKNLFLTDKKGQYYLAVLEQSKRADIKELAQAAGKKHLSFASAEKLAEVLKLTPGSVTPFGIINDAENRTTLIIDKALEDRKLLFHPNTNTKTISVEYRDLIKFIEHQRHEYIII